MLGVNRSCVSTEVVFISQQVLGKKSVSGRNWSSSCLSFISILGAFYQANKHIHMQTPSHCFHLFLCLFSKPSVRSRPMGEACWRLLDHVSEEQSASSYLLLPEWSMPVAMWWADLMRSNTWIQDLLSVLQKLILAGKGKSSLPMTSIEIQVTKPYTTKDDLKSTSTSRHSSSLDGKKN